MRSHTGDKPYQCKQCPEKFARSDLLSRHVNKNHGPAEGEGGKGNGRGVAGMKPKGRKPKFKSAMESLSGSLGPGYRPPFSSLPQAQAGSQQPQFIDEVQARFQQPQFMEGQQLPYNSQAPMPNQPFQPPSQFHYARSGHVTRLGPNPLAMVSATSTANLLGSRARGQNQAMYTVLGENGGMSGNQLDADEEAGAWVDIPR